MELEINQQQHRGETEDITFLSVAILKDNLPVPPSYVVYSVMGSACWLTTASPVLISQLKLGQGKRTHLKQLANPQLRETKYNYFNQLKLN